MFTRDFSSWMLWYRACEILKCLRKRGKKMRGWEKRETHHWLNHSEISQIIDKSVCPVWFCLALIPLKSISQTEYIVLPYNIRLPTLWTPFRGGILGYKKGVLKLITPESGLRHICAWFPISFTKLVIELNGSRYALFHWQNSHMRPVPNSTHLSRRKNTPLLNIE